MPTTATSPQAKDSHSRNRAPPASPATGSRRGAASASSCPSLTPASERRRAAGGLDQRPEAEDGQGGGSREQVEGNVLGQLLHQLARGEERAVQPGAQDADDADRREGRTGHADHGDPGRRRGPDRGIAGAPSPDRGREVGQAGQPEDGEHQRRDRRVGQARQPEQDDGRHPAAFTAEDPHQCHQAGQAERGGQEIVGIRLGRHEAHEHRREPDHHGHDGPLPRGAAECGRDQCAGGQRGRRPGNDRDGRGHAHDRRSKERGQQQGHDREARRAAVERSVGGRELIGHARQAAFGHEGGLSEVPGGVPPDRHGVSVDDVDPEVEGADHRPDEGNQEQRAPVLPPEGTTAPDPVGVDRLRARLGRHGAQT